MSVTGPKPVHVKVDGMGPDQRSITLYGVNIPGVTRVSFEMDATDVPMLKITLIDFSMEVNNILPLIENIPEEALVKYLRERGYEVDPISLNPELGPSEPNSTHDQLKNKGPKLPGNS